MIWFPRQASDLFGPCYISLAPTEAGIRCWPSVDLPIAVQLSSERRQRIRQHDMKRKNGYWIYRLIAVGVGIGILVALIYCAGLGRFWQIIAQASPRWIMVSVAFYTASWLFRTWRLRLFTNHAGKNIDMLELFKLYVSGFALNSILPARLGDVATAVFLRTKGIDMGRSAAIVLQSRILDASALVLLSLPVLVLFFEGFTPLWIMTAILFGLVVVVAPIGIVALDTHNRGSAILERAGSRFGHKFFKFALTKTRDTYDSYHQIASDKRLLVASMLLSLMMALFEGLTCFTISIAVGAEISIIVVIVAVSIANIGKSAPATPGGVGIYETILAGVLVLFGVGFDVAIVIAILDHSMKKMFNLLLGLPATTGMGFKMAQIYEMVGSKRPWARKANLASTDGNSYRGER